MCNIHSTVRLARRYVRGGDADASSPWATTSSQQRHEATAARDRFMLAAVRCERRCVVWPCVLPAVCPADGGWVGGWPIGLACLSCGFLLRRPCRSRQNRRKKSCRGIASNHDEQSRAKAESKEVNDRPTSKSRCGGLLLQLLGASRANRDVIPADQQSQDEPSM